MAKLITSCTLKIRVFTRFSMPLLKIDTRTWPYNNLTATRVLFCFPSNSERCIFYSIHVRSYVDPTLKKKKTPDPHRIKRPCIGRGLKAPSLFNQTSPLPISITPSTPLPCTTPEKQSSPIRPTRLSTQSSRSNCSIRPPPPPALPVNYISTFASPPSHL